MINQTFMISLVTLAAGVMFTAGATAQAQDYPNRPIRVVVPFSAGGAVDGPMRAIAQELGKRLKQQVIIDNKPGAGATIGSELVAKAAPDGYTLLLASQTNAISATLYSKLSFNPIDDFAPVSLLGREPGVLVVHPSVPAKSVAEVVALAKAKPTELNYSSSGNGSGQHRPAGRHGAAGRARHASDVEAHQGRQVAAAGHHRRDAFAVAARRADAGGVGPGGLFGLCLDGHARPQGHAAGDR